MLNACLILPSVFTWLGTGTGLCLFGAAFVCLFFLSFLYVSFFCVGFFLNTYFLEHFTRG